MNQKQQLEQHIIEKAMKDEQFRVKLQANPKEAIEQELGFRIPDQLKVQVLEENANTFYLVLPADKKSENTDELTEYELEAVSGGQAFYTGNALCTAGTVCLCTG